MINDMINSAKSDLYKFLAYSNRTKQPDTKYRDQEQREFLVKVTIMKIQSTFDPVNFPLRRDVNESDTNF